MICGNPDMINDTVDLLGKQGLERNRRSKPGNITLEKYWQTEKYWNLVRDEWSKILNGNNRICLKNEVDSNPLYIYKFSFAEEYKTSKNLTESYKNINKIINEFLIKDC